MTSIRACLLLVALAGPALAAPEIERHRVNVKIEPQGLRITANDELTVRRGDGEPLVLRLNSGLEVSSVLVDGAALEGREKLSDDGSTARWSLPLPEGDEERLLVSISYAGTVWQPGRQVVPHGGALLPSEAVWIPTDGHAAEWSVRLDVAAGLRTIMPGVASDRTVGEARTSVTWTSVGPWRRHDLALTPTERREGDAGVPAIGIWHGSMEDVPLIDAEGVRNAIARCAELLGPYPLPRLDVLWAGSARTEPGLAILGPRDGVDALDDAILAAWLGGSLGDDQGRGAWARGLRAYLRFHVMQEEASPERARDFRATMCGALEAGAAPGFDTLRTAAAFHALRREVGSEAFHATLRDVLRDRAGDEIGWTDWEQAFSRRAGRDLSEPVAQWALRPGGPKLRLVDVSVHSSGGRQRLAGTIRQVLGPGAAPWRLSVPIVVETMDGREETLIEVSGPETGFTMLLPSLALRVALDPDLQLPRRVDATQVTVWKPLLPDVRAGSDARRVTSLMRRLGETDDARRLIVDELRIAGFDVDESADEARLLERSGTCALRVEGAPVGGALPLTASPRTPDGGVTASGTMSDPGDDLTGRALVMDLPSATTDVLSFVRSTADIAAASGAVLLVVRLPAEVPEGYDALWLTASDGDAPAAQARALRAQMRRAPQLAVPAFVVPHGAVLDGPLDATIAWEEQVVTAQVVSLRLHATKGLEGDVVVTARLPDERDATAAIAVIEATQILAAHRDLLGRDVRVVFLPRGAGSVWADERIARAHPGAPLLAVGRVGDRGVGKAELLATADAAALRRVVAAAFAQATLPVHGTAPEAERVATATPTTSPLGSRVVRVISAGPDGPGSEPGAKKIGRVARAIALAVIAASSAR